MSGWIKRWLAIFRAWCRKNEADHAKDKGSACCNRPPKL